jgi:hypothetical protein
MSMLTKMSMVTSPSEQHKTISFKKNEKNRKKTIKNRKLFSIPKPKPIPTENRHLRQKLNPIPTEVKKSSPQGSSSCCSAQHRICTSYLHLV